MITLCMEYIVYISSMNKLYLQSELLQLLKSFRENNIKNNITGILLYHNGIIIQYIEGECHKIQKLYDNISKDSRHHNISIILQEKISERLFSELSLGFNSCRKLEENESFNSFLEYIEPMDLLHENKQHKINSLFLLFKSLNLINPEFNTIKKVLSEF